MENKEWLKELKVGDNVFIVTQYFDKIVRRLNKVERITPTGQVVIGKIRFKNGVGIGYNNEPYTPYTYRVYIEPTTEEGILKYKQNMYCVRVLERLKGLDKLTYEQATKIADVMGWDI